MKRRHLALACEGATLAATLDLPDGASRAGLLMVSGGNEPRAGASGLAARLAARLASEGYAVLRFDRRGVGDSTGTNAGFRGQSADIHAALGALRTACPAAIVAYGNCDAASALMLLAGAGADALVLANPWTLEATPDTLPAPALRAHYRRRLASPSALRRLFTGGVSLRRLARGLAGAAAAPAPSGLAHDMAEGLAGFARPTRILLAGRDRTADAFAAQWPRDDPRLVRCATASHGFTETEAGLWLEAQLLGALAELEGQKGEDLGPYTKVH